MAVESRMGVPVVPIAASLQLAGPAFPSNKPAITAWFDSGGAAIADDRLVSASASSYAGAAWNRPEIHDFFSFN